MGGRAILFLSASLLPWAGLRAQPLPADPSPDALEVAHAMVGAFPVLNPASDAARDEQGLEADLLNPYVAEPPCDRANAECLAAAQAIAREYAPAIRRRAAQFRDRGIAYGIMVKLEPAQLHRLAAYLRTAEGRDFVELWQLLFRPALSPERQQEIQCRAAAGLGEPGNEARRAFRERTAGLPRARVDRPYILPPTPQPSVAC